MDQDEMARFLEQEVCLEKYFTQQQLHNMADLEQKRYKNMVQNYHIQLKIGLPAIKPDFMKGGLQSRGRERSRPQVPSIRLSSSDSDDEWTPDMERRKRAKEKRKVPSFMCAPKATPNPTRPMPKRKPEVQKRKPEVYKVKADPVQRESYELRKNRTISFMNLEPPDDDHFLYCEDCNKDYEGDCPIHGSLTYIQDAEVEEKDPDSALHSLPPGLHVQESSIRGAGLGVFTQAEIPHRTMFGPYGGVNIKDSALAHASGYCWQIYKDGAPSHFVDAQDKATSNWMRYVNCALSEQEQNLVAFQYKGGIYYRSFKPILPGTELLVWYGDEYAKELGISKEDEALIKPIYISGECVYRCEYCHNSFSSMMYWAAHVKSKHAADKLTKQDIQRINQWMLTNHAACKKHEQVKENLGKSNHGQCDMKTCHCNGSTTCKCNKNINESCSAPTTLNVSLKQTKCIFENNKLDGRHIGHKETMLCNDSSNSYLSSSNKDEKISSLNLVKHCKVCGEYFDNKDKYILHIKQHLQETQAKYDACKSLLHERQVNVGERETARQSRMSSVCEKLPDQDDEVVMQERKHAGEKPYTCDVCGKSFNHRDRLHSNKMIHTGNRPYKCDVCNKSFNDCGGLVRHKRLHSGDQTYKCDVCSKLFNDSCNLTAHKRTHREDWPYKCDVCGKSFKSSGDLVKHKRTHTGDKPYKCDVCGKSFSQGGNLVTHKRTHTGDRPYKCDVCSKSFNDSGKLFKHKRTHTGYRPYKCDVCGKSFNDSGNLVKHKRTHTGERPYECDVCGKSFSASYSFIAHKRIHTGEKPYKCDVCGKSFKNSDYLVKHKRTHTGDRPYKCDVCGQSFNQCSNLVRHKRTHTGEKPYKCDVCGQSFARPSSLKDHKRRTHT